VKLLAPGTERGDEEWQLSKDSADAATAADSFQLVYIHYPNYAAAIVAKEWIVDK